MAKDFFEKIVYSACNEDSYSERLALKLNEEDVLLCITGSGSRPLDLLIDNPKKIISIDFNKSQNQLLNLKIAAYKTLTYKEFCQFIGLEYSSDRLQIYKKIKVNLLPFQIEYWNSNIELIKSGILYCGTWEKLLQGMLRMAFFRTKSIEKLFNSKNLEEQSEFWNKKWKNLSWKLFLKIVSNRFLWTKIIREPGAKLIPKEFSVSDYLEARLDHMANHFLLKDNHYANLIFKGYYTSECILPLHLKEENFEVIKERLKNIETINISLSKILDEKDIMSQITAFSLSDFSSYCTKDQYEEIWNKLETNSLKNSKICERFFLIKQVSKSKRLMRNTELENKLFNEDISSIYSFSIGKML